MSWDSSDSKNVALTAATLSTSYTSGNTTPAARPTRNGWVVWAVTVTDKSSAQTLSLRVEGSITAGADAEWTELTTGKITDGVDVASRYEYQLSGVDGLSVPKLFCLLPIEARGVPYLRLKLKADQGTPVVSVTGRVS
jgi:hypothetical protein